MKKAKVVTTEICSDNVVVIAFEISQTVCLDKLAKADKAKFTQWFKSTSELAAKKP